MKDVVVVHQDRGVELEKDVVPFVEDEIGDSVGDFVVPMSVLDGSPEWEDYFPSFIYSPNAYYYYYRSSYVMRDVVDGVVVDDERLMVRIDRELAVAGLMCMEANVESGSHSTPRFDVQELDCEVVVEDGSFVVGDGSDVTVNPLDVEYFVGNRWHDVVARFGDRLYCDDEGDLWVGNGVYGVPFQPSADIMRFRDLPGQKLFIADSVV